MTSAAQATVAVYSPTGSAIGDAVLDQLGTTAARAEDTASPGHLHGAVFVTGAPGEYGIEDERVGAYVAHVVEAATAIATTLASGVSESSALVIVLPPLSDTLSAGATPISIAAGALVGLCRALAVDLGDRGLRVNLVQPGLMHTASSLGPMPTIPLERPGGKHTEAVDVAHAVEFLLSDDSSYITGVQLDVDGGVSEDRHAAVSVLWADGLLTPDGPGLAALLT